MSSWKTEKLRGYLKWFLKVIVSVWPSSMHILGPLNENMIIFVFLFICTDWPIYSHWLKDMFLSVRQIFRFCLHQQLRCRSSTESVFSCEVFLWCTHEMTHIRSLGKHFFENFECIILLSGQKINYDLRHVLTFHSDVDVCGGCA